MQRFVTVLTAIILLTSIGFAPTISACQHKMKDCHCVKKCKCGNKEHCTCKKNPA